jgi:hypothetical protein
MITVVIDGQHKTIALHNYLILLAFFFFELVVGGGVTLFIATLLHPPFSLSRLPFSLSHLLSCLAHCLPHSCVLLLVLLLYAPIFNQIIRLNWFPLTILFLSF